MSFFAARQPILDREKNVFGYELLYRASLENVFPDVDEEKATSKMIEGLQFDLGLDRISGGKLAFINFTEDTLLSGYPELLPSNKVVVEILETVQATQQLYATLEQLHKQKYIIALDDFVHGKQWEIFYPLISIIKVDVQNASDDEVQATIDITKRFPHIKLLAEKVETHAEFNKALDQGFAYFQGYFFSRPEVIESVELTPSQSMLSSLLSEITAPEPNFNKVTQIFELDVTLSFKLLRYTKSHLFQRRKPIESIRQAVVVLGKAELERFIGILFAAQFGEGKPSELVRMSMQRAKFCETLAMRTHNTKDESAAFLTGMLSLIDAMLNTSLFDIIENLPLSASIKDAILRSEGWLAEALELCRDLEKGNWELIEASCHALNLEHAQTLEDFAEASAWSDVRLGALD